MTDPIRAALERLIARLDETTDPNGPVPAWSDSYYGARAALLADGPAVPEGREPASVVGEPSDEELLGLDQLEEAWNAQSDAANGWNELGLDEIIVWAQRQALARHDHHPAPPAEGEVGELVADLRSTASGLESQSYPQTAALITRAADLLEQRCPVPVPVSERLPGAGDCAPWPEEPDAAPWCWFGSDADGAWAWEQRSANEHAYHHRSYTHWLPANALPMPTTEPQP